LAELETIPTPLNLKWKRLRYQIVPIVVFCACALATAWLWKDYANGGQAYGEVTAVTYQVASPREGTLIELSDYPKVLDRVTPGKVLAKFDSSKLEARRKDVGEALTKSQKELAEATENLAEAEKGGGAKATVDEFKGKVAALTVVVNEHRTAYNDLERRISECTIVSPASGTVTAVKHQPNEFVKQGEEIFVITQDSGSYIVSYVRPYGGVIPKKDQQVLLRGQSRKTASSIVQEVGTKLEPIPAHQLGVTSGKKQTTTTDWGIPVRIAMPKEEHLPLKPGELVSVIFRNTETQ
jgi:multidrug resistance efflux pump